MMRQRQRGPLLAGEHFHVKRLVGRPPATFALPSAEGLIDPTWREPLDASPVVLYDLRIANGCDDESPDAAHVIAAAADGHDDGGKVKACMAQNGMTFETWLWVSAKDMRYYGVGPGLPATLHIDRAGRIRETFRGMVTLEQVRPLVERVLAEESGAPPSPPARGSSASARP